MAATLTSIAHDLTRVTIDWTDICQNGQGFFIFYGADGEMLRELEVYGWTTEYLQMAVEAIQSQEFANLAEHNRYSPQVHLNAHIIICNTVMLRVPPLLW